MTTPEQQPTTSLARVEASSRTNRTELFLRLVKIEEERSRTLLALGLTDAGVSTVEAPMIDTELHDTMDEVLKRIGRLEAKIFADGLVSSAPASSNGVSHHDEGGEEGGGEDMSDEDMIAAKAKELGCPKEWLFVMTSRGGSRYVNLRRGKKEELEALQKSKVKAKTPDEQAKAALKLDDAGLLTWAKNEGKSLIVNKRSGLSKDMRKEIKARLLK